MRRGDTFDDNASGVDDGSIDLWIDESAACRYAHRLVVVADHRPAIGKYYVVL